MRSERRREVPGVIAVLSSALVSEIVSAPWFRKPWSPFAVLDTDLTIRAVNAAFELATGQPREELVSRSAFDAFPANPTDLGADAVTQAQRSFERVLRTGRSDWRRSGRYDVPDRAQPGGFQYRVWLPVTGPVTEPGRGVGGLHHSQDVTRALGPDGSSTVVSDPRALAALAARLCTEFPRAEPAAVLGVLTDSLRVVLETLGRPDPDKATELARIRLEVQLAPSLLHAGG